MSRYAEIPITAILAAADRWKQECLVEQHSLFEPERQVWRPEVFAELEQRFIGAPDDGKDSFITKLGRQLAQASDDAKLLAIDLSWVLYLFPRKIIGPAKKISNLQEIAAIGQRVLDEKNHWALRTDVLTGIGSGGTFFNTGFWWEFSYAIYQFKAWSALPREQREALIQPDAELDAWLDQLSIPERLPGGQPLNPGRRMFRHIFLYLMQPDRYERIASTDNKRVVVKKFAQQLGLKADLSSASRIDAQLRVIRSRLEQELDTQDLDFYIEPLRSRWAEPSETPSVQEPATAYQAPPVGAQGAEASPAPVPALEELYGPAPRNVIFHGPPGTGKTRTLLKGVLPAYVDQLAQEDEETRLQRLLSERGWFEVIGAAILDMGQPAVTVPQLRDHPFIRARLATASSQANLGNRLWGMLQIHTVYESTTVALDKSRRIEPLVFDKDAESRWRLVPGWEAHAPELRDLQRLLRVKPAGPQQRLRYEMVTFHPSYAYEDFVEGLRPVAVEREGEAPAVEIRPVDGVLKRICRLARQNPDQRYALVIDEINRGNIAKIFGELITLIEPDKRLSFDAQGQVNSGVQLRLPYTGELFGVPDNLDLYGTMNTADRSIALVDIALRRRFIFRELLPDAQVIPGSDGSGLIADDEGEAIDLRRLLQVVNARITVLRGRDATIGHAYLTGVTDIVELRAAFRDRIVPLLQEYFFEDWERINQVLAVSPGAEPFLTGRRPKLSALFAGRAQGLDDADEARIWRLSPSLPGASFRALYEAVPDDALDL